MSTELTRAGLGCMSMSGSYGPADEDESIATIRAAVDRGVTLIDTGDFYGMGHNELLIERALRGRDRDSYRLSVKFGAMRGPDGSWLGHSASPAFAKTSAAYSLRRLGVDHIDVYRPARLDDSVPIEETIGAIAELVQAGYVREIGLSEVGPETIRRAVATHPIADLQIEYSLLSRGIEDQILPTCREHQIAVTAYGVLSRGLLSARYAAAGSQGAQGSGGPGQGIPAPTTGARDSRSRFPRFSAENIAHNAGLVAALEEIARARGASVTQLAFAWIASRGSDVIALIGAKRRDQLDEALAGLELVLDDATLKAAEATAPRGAAWGERYGAAQMVELDSERRS